MWTVKLSYELTGQDVLVAQFLGEENVLQIAGHLFESEPSPALLVTAYANADFTYSEIFIVWENNAAFDTWYAVHGVDWEELLAESNAYGAQQGVIFKREYPPYEDYDWLTVTRGDMELVEDLFQHLNNAVI